MLVYSPDGVAWSLRDEPAEWNEPGWVFGGVSVGADAAMVVRQSCPDPEDGPDPEHACPEDPDHTQVWRGTLAP